MTRVVVCLVVFAVPSVAAAATLRVCASGCQFQNLQPAIDAAAPGDTILLRAGETFVGNFVLKAKPASSLWITIRSDAADSSFPADGVRLVPSGKPGANTDRSLLPRLVGSGGTLKTTPVIRTQPGAHHYLLKFLELDGSGNLGYETLIYTGDDTTAATATDIVFDRIYAHGHPVKGQKRGISLNSVRTDILNSYFSDFKAVNADSQAIAGYNGAGPFRIINNYLEGAGENILFGGADPAVENLVPTGIEIKRNTITKPLAWRKPILAAPSSLRGSDSGTSGSLTAGTHYFKVVALMSTGNVVAHSPVSNEAPVTVAGSRSASLSWTGVAGADRYRIYRGTSTGGQSRYLETTSAVTTFKYSGASEKTGTPPAKATHWVVKNLIELKNAQHVTFDGNIIEHIWASGQFGYAVVLTPRNQSGGAPWVRVRDVTFTNNVIRHGAGAMQIVGYDSNATTQQTQRITVRNNLFYDIDPSKWGNYSKTFLIGEGPAGVVIDRNTIIHNASAVVYAYGELTTSGFSFTNNVTQHNTYGIMAEGGRPGQYSLDMYFPSANVTSNVFLGGRPADYPTPNTFVTSTEWQESFVNAAAHDYQLRTSSVFYNAGSGGTVPGADMARIKAALAAATTTDPEPEPEPAPAPTNTAPVARHGGPYTTAVDVPVTVNASGSSDAEGAIASYLWRWSDDIVIRAAQVPAADIHGSAWVRTTVSDAAGGAALNNPDRGAAKISAPLAAPSSYVDVRFYAAAGVPYRFWMRTQAHNDAWTNDSLYVQFSGRVDASGNPIDRIGTTDGTSIMLEEGSGAGVAGWGWNDENYGGVAGPIYFATSGVQTLRIQQREDGVMWDQIVISANAYRAVSPGKTKYDQTVVSSALGTSAAALAAHTYVLTGTYPLVLEVRDASGLTNVAATTVTVSPGGTADPVSSVAGGPYSGTLNQAITFSGSGSTASTSAQYLWTFGDEIVLDALAMTATGTRWRRVADASAAQGTALENPNLGEAKITSPLAAPSSYVEATFRAAAGVPYRVWVRMRAANDSWANDSVFLQFSGSVDASGAAVYRLGSTNGASVILEYGSGAGLLGWGWAGSGYGTLGAPVYFNSSGEQRIRIQQREDGLRIDQIVISADSFYQSAPGSLKQDTTVVPAVPEDARGVVVSRAFGVAGVFPVTISVIDGGTTTKSTTTVTIR